MNEETLYCKPEPYFGGLFGQGTVLVVRNFPFTPYMDILIHEVPLIKRSLLRCPWWNAVVRYHPMGLNRLLPGLSRLIYVGIHALGKQTKKLRPLRKIS